MPGTTLMPVTRTMSRPHCGVPHAVLRASCSAARYVTCMLIVLCVRCAACCAHLGHALLAIGPLLVQHGVLEEKLDGKAPDLQGALCGGYGEDISQ